VLALPYCVSVLGQCTSSWVDDLTHLVVKGVQPDTLGLLALFTSVIVL